MKKLHATKLQYDEFLYPIVAAAPSENTKEAFLTDKVLTVLEAVGSPPKMKDDGLPLEQPWFKLKTDEVEFELEDAHADLILKKMEAAIPTLQTWRVRQMLPLVTQLKKES